jgi:hypothetical protein
MGSGAELIAQCFNLVLYRVSENRIAGGQGQHETDLVLLSVSLLHTRLTCLYGSE